MNDGNKSYYSLRFAFDSKIYHKFEKRPELLGSIKDDDAVCSSYCAQSSSRLGTPGSKK